MFFRKSGILFAIVSFLFAPSAINATNSNTATTIGMRMGEESVEGYVDLILPLSSTDENVLFLNPRLSLSDQGQNEMNVGVGYRHMVNDAFVIGTNIFVDTRESAHNNRFNQWGAGLEFLGNYIDGRFNFYDADNEPKRTNSFQTETEQKSVQYSDTTSNQGLSYSVPYASGHEVLYDAITAGVTTRKTTTTTTTTHQWFDEFEAGMDGWDLELGFKFPNKSGPEMRLFGGYYDYQNPVGEDVNGLKGRFELRSGPYFTIDAELFENAELNKSNYFLGFRLQIPFHREHTWESFTEGLSSMEHRDLRKRIGSEMIMRDVRIQTKKTGPQEDLARRTVEVEQKTSTKVIGDSGKTEKIVAATGITFVDKDNAGSGSQDGTAENPYGDANGGIQKGIDNAGANSTIFVSETNDGSSYDEQVVMQEGQTLTSEITFSGGPGPNGSYKTSNSPLMRPITDGSSIITMSDNTTVHRMHVDATMADFDQAIYAGAGNSGRNITISETAIITGGGWEEAIIVENSNISNTNTIIINNLIGVSGEAYGVSVHNSNSSESLMTISGNDISITDGGWWDAVYITNSFSDDVEINISDNKLLASGDGASALWISNRDSDNIKINVNSNSIITSGTSNSAYGAYVDNFRSDNSMVSITDNSIASNDAAGSWSYGLYWYGFSSNNASLQITTNTISSAGTESHGLLFWNNSTIYSGLDVSTNDIATTGVDSDGIFWFDNTANITNTDFINNNFNVLGAGAQDINP